MPAEPISPLDLANLEPSSEDDRHKRAMFVAVINTVQAIELIRECLSYCDTLDFTSTKALTERKKLTETEHHSALKEIGALNVWISYVEQIFSGMPGWLEDFYADCWSALDMLYSSPTSNEILDLYPSTAALDETFEMAGMRLSHSLHVGSAVADSPLFIAKQLKERAESRSRTLNEALRLPLSELDTIVKQATAAV